MLGKDYAGQHCALARALELVGERWTLLIVRDAFYGVRRFSDFAARLDIPRAVLSDRLAGLVTAGLLARTPDCRRPGRDLYELTDDGQALWPALHALASWGTRFFDGPAPRQFAHDGCGRPLDEHGTCPRCGQTPGPTAIVTSLHGPPARDDPVTAALRPRRHLLDPLTTGTGP